MVADLDNVMNVVILCIFIFIIFLMIFGQNWRAWYANRQLKKSLRKVMSWRIYGINVIEKIIEPFLPPTINPAEMDNFINKLLEFTIIKPSSTDVPIYEISRNLIFRKRERVEQMILNFLPNLKIENKQDIPTKSVETVNKIISLINATSEIHNIYKNIKNHIFLGKRIKSSFYIEEAASKISQEVIKANAYRMAIDSFQRTKPIGDSIGPLVIRTFIEEYSDNSQEVFRNYKYLNDGMISYAVKYKDRNVICIKPMGSSSNVGYPGSATNKLIKEYENKNKPLSLIITIDAVKRLYIEDIGSISQAIGVAIGDGGINKYNIEKYEIETAVMNASPPIKTESIMCKMSLEEALSPINEKLINNIPVMINILKSIIRTQSNVEENIVIIGIGNSLGVKND